MKQIILIISFILFYLITINATQIDLRKINYSPQTAPPFNRRLDFSSAIFDLKGVAVSATVDSNTTNHPPFGPARLIWDSSNRRGFWQVGDFYYAYWNDTIAINFLLLPQNNSLVPVCGIVPKYNYSNYLADFFDYLNIDDAKKKNANKALYSPLALHNANLFDLLAQQRLSRIVDIYYSYASDIGTAVRDGTGCQKLPFSGFSLVSRALYRAGVGDVLIGLDYGQYFPGASSDNTLRGRTTFTHWDVADTSQDPFNLVPLQLQQACNINPINYCDLYNSDTIKLPLVA